MNNNISMGFEKLDAYIKNNPKNALVYICAKPGIGLKTFSKNILDDIKFPEIKGNFPTIALFDLCRENEINISKIEQQVQKVKPDAVYINCLQYIDTDTKYDNTIQKTSGISRSAGVAAGILDGIGKDSSLIFDSKMYFPNMLCYRKTLNAFKTE